MNLNFPSSNFLQFIYTIIIGSGTESEIARNDLDMEINVPKNNKLHGRQKNGKRVSKTNDPDMEITVP